MTSAVTPPPGAGLRPDEIAARSGSSFLTGFLCLDASRRDGMTAIYAFCRVADDAADDAPDPATGRAHVQFWRDELVAAAAERARTPVGIALQATMRRCGLRADPLHDLLDGVTMDLDGRGIADEEELRGYCARVASAVGRACLPVLGAEGPDAVAFADHLGLALQLTNILRDLRTDAEVGRVYVPRTWLAEFGVDPQWLRGSGPADAYSPSGAVARLCHRFVERAEAEFAAARARLAASGRARQRALVPARIMGAVYEDLLRRLAQNADPRGARVRVPRLRKLWLATCVWTGFCR